MGVRSKLLRDKKAILRRLEDVLNDVVQELKEAEKVMRTSKSFILNPAPGNVYLHLNTRQISQLSSRMYNTIRDLAPSGSLYRETADDVNSDGLFEWKSVARLYGLLKSLKADYEKDYMTNISELIDAELFSDVLEQADYLFSENYVRASIVVAGVALEGHLRKLAEKHSIPIQNDGKYVKAEMLNQQLVKSVAYDKTYQKSVTSWLGLRNDAAHPDNKEIHNEMVKLMIEGIRNFIQRFPA